MMLFCLLCACGGGKTEPIQAPVDYRAALLRAGGCRFRAEGRAEQGDRICEFALDCLCRADGSAQVTVLEPESVAGVTAAVDGGSGALVYDGVRVSLGLTEDLRLAPLAAPATVLAGWLEGDIVSAGEEDNALCAVFELEPGQDPLSVYTWFAAGEPVRAELVRGGAVRASLRLTDFQWIHGGYNETAEENLG